MDSGQWWGGGDWVFWLLREGERGKDRNERERERERGEINNLLIILLYNLYDFNVLYSKIKVRMFGELQNNIV